MSERERYIVFVEGQPPAEILATARTLDVDLDMALYDGDRLVGWFDHRWLQGWVIVEAEGASGD